MDSRALNGRTIGEVRGDDATHVGQRVEELVDARLKAPLRSVDGTGGQVSGVGCEVIVKRAQVESVTRFFIDPSEAGPSSSALAEGMLGSKRDGGPSSQGPSVGENLKRVVDVGVGPAIGSSRSKGKGWAAVEGPSSLFGPSVLIRDSPGSAQTLLLDSGLSRKVCSSIRPGTSSGCNLEIEFLKLREKET